jgi:hypothetical protein
MKPATARHTPSSKSLPPALLALACLACAAASFAQSLPRVTGVEPQPLKAQARQASARRAGGRDFEDGVWRAVAGFMAQV